MIETLEYRFRQPEEVKQPALLEIDAPKVFIDGVTSGYGPLLSETRANEIQRLLSKTFDGNGGVTLGFDVGMFGRGWKGQPNDRATRVLAVVGQIEAAANRHGVSDPRIQFSVPFEHFAPDDCRVSFLPPANLSGEQLAANIRFGMIRAAALLPFTVTNNTEHITVTHSVETGFALYSRMVGRGAVLRSDPSTSSDAGRVELISGITQYPEKEAQARLVALMGIISALGPILPTEQA